MKVGVHKIGMASPDDVTGLSSLISSGEIDPNAIVAVIGKTEGNGGANDFTRGYATLSFARCIAACIGLSTAEVMENVAFVWSGGTEGVLSPHATIFTRKETSSSGGAGPARLALGIVQTRDILPEEIGRPIHVEEVARAVDLAREQAGISDLGDVHYVQVKGPLLTPNKIADADKRGIPVVTRDPNGSKAFARGAMALGVAVGLGEIKKDVISASMIAFDMSVYSAVASTSAGGELSKCEILLFGNAPGAMGDLRIGHATLSDVLDVDAVRAALRDAGLEFEHALGNAASDVVSVFAKAEAAATLRGRRTTMISDADINYERHARAALGAAVASIIQDTAIFISGGTEHQCPPGSAPIAAIVRCGEASAG